VCARTTRAPWPSAVPMHSAPSPRAHNTSTARAMTPNAQPPQSTRRASSVVVHVIAEEAPEPGYRPSTALDEFVRMRDMMCRFPGCGRPATFGDIDHTRALSRWAHSRRKPQVLLPKTPPVKASSEGNPYQLLNAAFLALVVIPKAPSLSARSDPDWNCDIPSPYRRRAQRW
jgi:hypothetical protein